jgi:pyruvate,water dikinase
MAVVVQQFIFAEASAVAFSVNPVSGDRSEVVINANYGLGQAVVGGVTTPDMIVVRKDDFTEQVLTIGSKALMTVTAAKGTQQKTVPREMRGLPALTPEQAAEIAELACRLESSYGWPVDLECAIEGSNVYLLQCRQITAL